MIRSLIKIAVGAVLLGSTVFLAVTGVHDRPSFRIAAAIIAGLPGAVGFGSGIGELVSRPNRGVQDRIKRMLQTSINQIYRKQLYPGDITKLSFHVWVVPKWYRVLVPYRIRRKVKKDHRRMPVWLRPKLQRVTMFRWEHHPPSGISFRKGIGIIGRCVDLNQEGKPLRVRLDGNRFQSALRRGTEHWSEQHIDVTHNLKFKDAEELAKSYGQVAAAVLRETSGEAIGCISLELPPGLANYSLVTKSGHELLEVLRATAEHVEMLLTSRTVQD